MGLFDRLIDDAAMFPPGNADAAAAVARHLDYRAAWFAGLIGPLVVEDQQLAAVGRAVLAADSEPVEVSVVNSSGAGGLVSLAGRSVPGIRLVAAESALRDLDDLAGNAARVISAAEDLDDSVQIFVELPFAPGWQRAVELVEAAGLQGKIRTGGVEAAFHPSARQLAEQLSILVEADLPFKATAGLHRAWPHDVKTVTGGTFCQHGFLSLMLALEATIDGADLDSVAQLLARSDHDQLSQAIQGWTEAQAGRVRRRFVSFGCCGVTEPIDDLVELGLVKGSR